MKAVIFAKRGSEYNEIKVIEVDGVPRKGDLIEMKISNNDAVCEVDGVVFVDRGGVKIYCAEIFEGYGAALHLAGGFEGVFRAHRISESVSFSAFSALVRKLISFGPSFPRYPSQGYQEVRSIGFELDKLGGDESGWSVMSAACEIVGRVHGERTKSSLGPLWDGIGNWRN
jgi:hypothetical protein